MCKKSSLCHISSSPEYIGKSQLCPDPHFLEHLLDVVHVQTVPHVPVSGQGTQVRIGKAVDEKSLGREESEDFTIQGVQKFMPEISERKSVAETFGALVLDAWCFGA